MRGKVIEQHEYRINKKGAECYRTEFYEECREKLAELNARRPVYTMQHRMIRQGGYIDRPCWSPWEDC